MMTGPQDDAGMIVDEGVAPAAAAAAAVAGAPAIENLAAVTVGVDMGVAVGDRDIGAGTANVVVPIVATGVTTGIAVAS
jgi:hypothetical protein